MRIDPYLKSGRRPRPKTRPDHLKHFSQLYSSRSPSYQGVKESFGSVSHMAKKLGLKKLAVNYHVLRSGERSSLPHAHSHQEEFVLVLDGRPTLWMDGKTYDLEPGDVMALIPGTGSAHTILNNAPDRAYLLVVGEQLNTEDKIHFPLDPKVNGTNAEQGFAWEDAPERTLGRETAEPKPFHHRRQHKRLDACFPVFFESKTTEFEAWCLDVSRGGMFIKAEGDLPAEGTQLKFRLDLSTSQRQALEGNCTVRWVREKGNGEDAPRGFGVQFINLNQEVTQGITDLIESIEDGVFSLPYS